MEKTRIATPLASIKFPLTVAEMISDVTSWTAQHGDDLFLRQYGSHVVIFTEGELCGCTECLEKIDSVIDSFYSVASQGMIVCTRCGNKRCPHADSHRYACTKSNVYGQSPVLLPEFQNEGQAT